MSRVHPSAWERVGYEDGKRGNEPMSIDVGKNPSEHEKECDAAYLNGYARGKSEREKK